MTVALALGLPAASAGPSGPRIVKVVPLLLDEQGRAALAPSLFERDAYQAELRADRAHASGLRFEVQARGVPRGRPVTLRLELRGSRGVATRVVETPWSGRGWLERWTAVELAGEAFQELGQVIAWRASLHEGGLELAEQRSFLWQNAEFSRPGTP